MTDETDPGDLLPPGCGLGFAWVFVNILGVGVGWALGWGISYRAPGIFSTAALGLVLGGVSGAFQWLVLRGHLKNAGWWVLATALGWMGGLFLGVEIAQQLGLAEYKFGAGLGLVAGTILGIAQWLVLRRQMTSAIVWIPASTFAWAASLLYYRAGATWLGAFLGILYGIVSGIVLVWLLYRPTRD